MNMNLLKRYMQELIVKTGANVPPRTEGARAGGGGSGITCKGSNRELLSCGSFTGRACVDLWQRGASALSVCRSTDSGNGASLGGGAPAPDVKDLPVRIFIESADPDKLSGISADVLSFVARMRSAVTKKYRDEINGKHEWLIVAAPSPAWAKKGFQEKRRMWQSRSCGRRSSTAYT